ncbi:MAG: hypothetical protein RR775_21260 [Massilia sp.]|uniref:hypothetical protein n=1 Tax=Massilia sp. TaxID=1882437 RepID=UPI002FC5883B
MGTELVSGYGLATPADIQRGNGRLFYLVPKSAGWRISFEREEFERIGGERLQYWPDGKKIKVVFDHSGANDRSQARCNQSSRDRKKHGYTLCTSSFVTANTSGVMVAARVIAGLSTAGLSEVDLSQKGAVFLRLDTRAMLEAVAQLDVDRQFWLKDYRQRGSARTVTALGDFIRQYAHDDPEQLLPQAKQALERLRTNAKLLEDAERATPTLAQYKRGFMPRNPEKYCNGLKANAADFSLCQSEAPTIVSALAEARATQARRLALCQKLAQHLPQSGRTALCKRASASPTCSATASPEQRVCDILNRQGQS